MQARCLICVAALTAGSPLCAAGVPSYTLIGSFELPAGSASFDTLPDGRVLSIVGHDFYAQDAASGSTWTRVGSLPAGTISSFGASFVRVSPDGATIAVGDNNFGPGATVYTFASSLLDPSTPSAATAWASSNLDAHWASNGRLYIAGASAGGEVREIDLNSMSSRIVLSNIGLSAGGVTTDGSFLYAGNGFDLVPGGTETGDVRAYDLAAISSAVSPFDFEASGITVSRALSGASLGFDPLGNMLIGGGDLFGGSSDYGYAAVVDANAIDAALLGGPAAPDAAELRLMPGAAGHSYFPRMNTGTGELIVSYFDNGLFTPGTTVYRYAIPGPGSIALGVCFAALRRRRA